MLELAHEHGGDILDLTKTKTADFIGIKRRRILRRFQKYQPTLVAKCT
jgi:hypothetical protein